MPIFENELGDNKRQVIPGPKPFVASPDSYEVNTNVNISNPEPLGGQTRDYGGMTIEQLSNRHSENTSPSFDSPFQMIPKGELIENKRYALYERGKDLENIYGLDQSWATQLANGVIKMGLVAGGTYAQSFATIPNTVEAIRNGKMSELSGGPDGYEADIDRWLKNVEDVFPNYVTRKEQESPFLAAIPGFAGSANFWGNSIIKNIGFTVGAIGGALTQDAIIGGITGSVGAIPLVAAQAAKLGKAALYINKIFTGADDVAALMRGRSVSEGAFASLTNLSRLAAAERVTSAARYGLNLYGSARTEAAIEARDGYATLEKQLTDNLKTTNLGVEPTAEQIAEIKEYSTDAMNTRFGINMALLTVSNAIQFDNILKPFTKTVQGSLTQTIEQAGKIGLVSGSLDTFERKVATTVREKAWDLIKPKVSTIFSEGILEEGGQFAAEKGVYDYYTRKYKAPGNESTWSTINEVLKSTNKGLMKQFTTTEGIQNMMIGALSSVITGGLMGKIESRRNGGKDQRINSSLNMLNNFGLTGILSDKYGDTVDAAGIAKDMADAAATGDLHKYKNFQNDMFFNFVTQRIPSGMHDVTIEQLKMLKELDADQFQKMFGLDATGDNQKTSAEYVDQLIDKANRIKDTFDALDRTFKNPFTFNMDPKEEKEYIENRNYSTFNNWKTDLAALTNESEDAVFRIADIETTIMNLDSRLSNDLVSQLTNPEALIDLADNYEERAVLLEKSITPFTSLADKRKAKEQIKVFRTFSERINLAKAAGNLSTADFSKLLNFEVNNHDSKSTNNIPTGEIDGLLQYGVDLNKLEAKGLLADDRLENLSTKEGFEKYMDEADSIANDAVVDVDQLQPKTNTPELPLGIERTFEFINKQGLKQKVDIGRSYELPKFKKTTIRKITNDRFKVTDDQGNVTYHKTRKQAEDAAEDIRLDNDALSSVTILALNDDGTVKVEDIDGNIQNIPLSKLRGFRGIETEQEQLIRNAAAVVAGQNKLTIKSGTVTINSSTENTSIVDEGKLKSNNILFTSSTSLSEKRNTLENALPHVQRSRIFLNNVDTFANRGDIRAILVTQKQIDALGMSGLIQTSFNLDPSTEYKDVPLTNEMGLPTNVNDVDFGFLAQVYVVQENGALHYVDVDGKKLSKVGEPVSMSDVVFQTMPTTSIRYPDGTPRYRADQADSVEAYSDSYRKFRAELFAADERAYSPHTFVVSRGIAKEIIINNVKEKNHVGGILVPENKISTQEGLIMIPTLGVVTDNLGGALSFPKGTPVIKYGSNIEFLNNRKYNVNEANTIFQVIKAFADKAITQAKNKQTVEVVNDYSIFLQNVMYWRKTSAATGNQINIEPINMSISIGLKSYPMSEIANYESEIVENLQQNYLAVNNTTVFADLSTPFYEYRLNSEGTITEDDYVEWDNYQTYLLSSKDYDGKPRNIGDTPLSTSVAKPTDSVPYSFENKYATLNAVELALSLPQAQKALPPTTPTVDPTIIGEHKADGTTVNTYQAASGPILFTANINGNAVEVTVMDNPTVDSLIANPTMVASFKANLITINVLSPTDVVTEEEVIKTFIGLRISSELQSTKDNTTVVVPAKPPTAPTVLVVDGFTIDGVTENVYTGSKAGNIDFVANIDPSGAISVEVLDNSTTVIITQTPATMAAFRANLSALGMLTPSATDTEIVKTFVGLKISSEIQKVYDASNKPPTVPPAAPVAPVVQQPAVIVPPPAASVPTGPNRFSGFNNGGLPSYREAGDMTGQMSDEKDMTILEKWHADNLPNIPYKILDRLVTMNNGELAWGVFEDGVAKFVKGGLRGTEYHELFEGVYNGMLTTEEQFALLEEFKSRQGQFTDRASGEKIDFSLATNEQAKERIADDFADFRVGKLPARTLMQGVKNFFNRIIAFIKSFLAKKTLKHKLFTALDKGEFKERTLSKNILNIDPQYRAIDGLSEELTHIFVQDMTARAAGILYKEGQKQLLFTPEAITSAQMFSTIENQYLTEMDSNGFSKREILGDQAWNALKAKTLLSLQNLGIAFSGTENTINTEGSNKNDYISDTFTTNWKEASTGAIKFSVATLIEAVNTNQEANLTLVLPQPKTTIAGFQLLNFSRSFATLLDKLSNTNSPGILSKKLNDLAGADANYVRMFQRLGGDLNTREIPFDSFTADDWRYFIQFSQTFTKQKPDALIQYVTGNEVYTQPANLFTAAKQKQARWLENIKLLSSEKESLIKRNFLTKSYAVDQVALALLPSRTPTEMTIFLSKLGIDFPMSAYSKLKTKGSTRKTNEQVRFVEAVQSIKTYLGENGDIMSVAGKTLGINTQLTTLANLLVNVTNPSQESTYYGVDNQQIGAFADNNAPSYFENAFNEVNNLEELLVSRPELNDIFSANSLVLKPGGLFFDKNGDKRKDFKVSNIQGTKLIDTNKGVSIGDLTLGQRFVQEMNQNLKGNYYIVMPADGSTEWMMNLGNNVSFSEVSGTKGSKKVNDIFRNYLYDDIALALDHENRTHIRALKGKATELRFFRDILPEKQLSSINDMISKGSTQSEIEAYINYKENLPLINDSIQEFVKNYNEELKNTLLKNREILPTAPGRNAFIGLDNEFANKEKITKESMSDKQIDDVINYVNINYIINNIEYHKILFGDPLQFAVKKGGILDETKRIKSFLSPRRKTFDSPELNTHLNQTKNIVNGIQLEKGDPGYHVFKAYANTVTLSDVENVGSLSNINPAYAKNNEADAASWLMDGTYREIKLKNGQWSDKAEEWHQWHMAYTRQNMPGYEYTNNALKKQDADLVKTKEPKHKIEILKPIISGNKYGETQFDLVLDKLSQMPLYYKMVQGKIMEKHYIKNFKEGINYSIMISGRKVGAEELHDIYNQNGTFNEKPYEGMIKVGWNIYGIQVETTSDAPKVQTRGSQLTKGASIDLFDNGAPSSPEALAEYLHNTEVLNLMHENAYSDLLGKLGVVDTGNGFVMPDGVAVSNTLMHEMTRRAVSDNTIDAIQLDESGNFPIPFEAAPSYQQIRNILYSMIDKALISPKVSGGAHVQVPVTMFESALDGRGLTRKVNGVWEKITRKTYETLTAEEKKGVLLTDDTLKFYTEDDKYCEVMLPAWFKDRLGKNQRNMSDEELINFLNNTKDGKEILRGIGFRIPTQAVSSIEVFRVKGFLPSYMGSTVVVPSEITTKAGSDFDIDKLNMYLKSIYEDRSGNTAIIKYYGSKEATEDFYFKVFTDITDAKIVNKLNLLEALDIANYDLPDPKNLLQAFGHIIDSFKGNYVVQEDGVNTFDVDKMEDASIRYSNLITDTGISIDKMTDENLLRISRDLFIKDKYKKALENEYYASLERLLTLPEVFTRLIQPIGDAGLEDLSVIMDELRGYSETGVKNKILNRNYLTSMRHSFLTAKKWVGIAAVTITGLSLKQKSQVYLDYTKIDLAEYKDKLFLGDGKIALPHNTTYVNGENLPSLSGRTVVGSEELISDRLSGYATAFVDVAKGDYITKIIQSNLSVGVFMLLETLGVGDRSAYFCNQPIISEYLDYLDSMSVKNLFVKKHLDIIKDRFPTTSDVSGFDVSQESLEKNMRDFYTKKGGLSDAQNAEQQNILTEFLKYAKMAEHNFKFTMATNYDTANFRSSESFSIKKWKTQEARQYNIISSVDKILDNSFVGVQSSLTEKSMDAMGAILKLDSPEFKAVTDPILKTFAKNDFISGDSLEKLAVEIKAGLIDYVVQISTGLNTELHSLLVDDVTSIPLALEKVKMRYPNMKLLQDLEIVSGNRVGGAKSVRLTVKAKDSYEENLYTGYMRELRDYNLETNTLYKQLINLSILQGTYSSAISIRNIIPIEDYSAIVAPIIQQLKANNSLDAYKNGMFHRNNFRNDDVVPTIKNARFFKTSEFPLAPVFNEYGEEEGDQYHFASDLFPNIPAINVKPTDRKVMLLSLEFNASEVKNDFLKVPRNLYDPGTKENIDISTGFSIVDSEYRRRKLKGDPSLNDYYVYKKVYMYNNEPLITMQTRNKKTYAYSVYKLVNVFGDGNRATENYTFTREEGGNYGDRPGVINPHSGQSVFDNGGVKTDEIPDSVLIQNYNGGITENDVTLQTNTVNIVKNQERIAQLSRELEDLENRKEAMMQGSNEMLIVNALPKIKPDSAKKETGAKVGTNQDISPALLSNNGVTVQEAAHNIWENNFFDSEMMSVAEIRDVIIDILTKGKINYINELNRQNEIDSLNRQIKSLENTSGNVTPELNNAFAKTWETNAYAILNKFPTMTQDIYESMSEEEKNNLLECL